MASEASKLIAAYEALWRGKALSRAEWGVES